MAGGYAGKILRLNLTNRSVSTIDTEQYEEYGGGHGIGSAIYWDIMEDKSLADGFDPKNIVTIMGSPLSGTLTPGAAGRCEVQGVSAQQYPINWYSRAGFGGRFPGMLRYAGWDGIVIEGKADSPVWINIINDQVTFEDASDLWGLTTWEAQEEIWRRVTGASHRFNEWLASGDSFTTQRPAVLCIGQAGENLCRNGCLIHDAGNGAGNSGLGGVWGSKNLKAISVIGAGSIDIADPKALMEARLWYRDNFAFDVDNPGYGDDPRRDNAKNPQRLCRRPGDGITMIRGRVLARPQACQTCPVACRIKTDSGTANESQCVESIYYVTPAVRDMQKVIDLPQLYGVNAYETMLLPYLRELNKMGVLGPGKQIECDLPFDKYGTLEFVTLCIKEIAFREGIGDDLAEAWARAAVKWGRYEEDTNSGLLALPNWGHTQHYEPRVEVALVSLASYVGWTGSCNHTRAISQHCGIQSTSIRGRPVYV
jgi:aldehyde:ferredoxin oxidoreductase